MNAGLMTHRPLKWCQVRFLARTRRPASSPHLPHNHDWGSIQAFPILKYPHPKLRAENEEVKTFDEVLAKNAAALFKCMYQLKGVGLAAPQVGINQRLIVFNDLGCKGKGLPAHEVAMVNPKIVGRSEGSAVDQESCLSLPLVYGDVPRSLSVIVAYQTLQGESRRGQFSDYAARIIQHEVDHLEGVLFIDHMHGEEMAKYRGRLQRYIDQFGEGGVP